MRSPSIPWTSVRSPRRSGLKPEAVASMLLMLELKGEVETRPGGRYCRAANKPRGYPGVPHKTMSTNLVIVESPAKANTIKKYLGNDFEVLASYGHVRDLVPKEGAVDPEHGFAMRYQIIEHNEKHVRRHRQALKKAKSPVSGDRP